MSRYWIVFKRQDGSSHMGSDSSYALSEGVKRPERTDLYKLAQQGPSAFPVVPYKRDTTFSIDLERWTGYGPNGTRVIETLWQKKSRIEYVCSCLPSRDRIHIRHEVPTEEDPYNLLETRTYFVEHDGSETVQVTKHY